MASEDDEDDNEDEGDIRRVLRARRQDFTEDEIKMSSLRMRLFSSTLSLLPKCSSLQDGLFASRK